MVPRDGVVGKSIKGRERDILKPNIQGTLIIIKRFEEEEYINHKSEQKEHV